MKKIANIFLFIILILILSNCTGTVCYPSNNNFIVKEIHQNEKGKISVLIKDNSLGFFIFADSINQFKVGDKVSIKK